MTASPHNQVTGALVRSTHLTKTDLELHAGLGITSELLADALVQRVTDHEAREALSSRRAGNLAGVLYPYLNPINGHRVTCRLRRDHPEVEGGRPKDKYLSPYGDRRHLYFAPGAALLLADASIPVVFVEAEKSALALTAASACAGRSVLAMGTGGCWGWRGTIGKDVDVSGARVDEKGPCADFDLVTWVEREAIILFDSNTILNSKVQAARRALAEELVARGANVRIGDLPVEEGINGPDDYIGRYGAQALWTIVDAARPVQPSTSEEVLQWARLDHVVEVGLAQLEERLRHLPDLLRGADALRRRTVRELVISKLKAAKVSGAPALVDAAIGALDDGGTDAGPQLLADDPPWPEPVDGVVLFNTLAETLTKYVVLPSPHTARAIVLWVVLTYMEAATNLLPLLLVTSPTKRCGKTRTLELLAGLACRALPVSNITAAALYRSIDRFRPTLLIDEADTFLNDDPEMRGVINAGHTRHTARVIRCVGDDSEPTLFSTWCPKLVAMIGVPKDTIVDRSVVVRLERKGPGEPVVRLRSDTVPQLFGDLRRQLRRWADDHLDAMRRTDPAMPRGLHDRATDNWRPLVAIGDLAGGTWSALAREAAMALAGNCDDDEPIGEELLADLWRIFNDEDHTQQDCLSTARVTELLGGLETRPWAAYAKGARPISQHQVARLLRRFGVRPIKAKLSGKATNVYLRADLQTAWDRYTPATGFGTPEPVSISGTESTILSRNRPNEGSDPGSALSSIATAVVPRFQPEIPSSGTNAAVEVFEADVRLF